MSYYPVPESPMLLQVELVAQTLAVLTSKKVRSPFSGTLRKLDAFLEATCWEHEYTGLVTCPEMMLGKAWKTLIKLHPECRDPECGRFHRSHKYGEGVKWQKPGNMLPEPRKTTEVLTRSSCR